MSKKKSAIQDSNKEIKQLVKKDLRSLIFKVNPEINDKKLKKTIKQAGRILVKAANAKSKPVLEIENINSSTTE